MVAAFACIDATVARCHARCNDPAAPWLRISQRSATIRRATTICEAQTVEAPAAPPSKEDLNGKDLRPNQLFSSALPPRKGRATRIEHIADGLWTFTQPFPIPLVGDPDLRMTVATLGDGTLLLHAPVAPTGEVLEALEDIGRPVGHIVLPNGSPEHWYFGPALAAAFPDATVWVAPGLLEGRRTGWPLFRGKELEALGNTHTVRTLEDGAPEEWDGEVGVAVLDTATLAEASLVLRKYGALLVSDTMFWIDDAYANGAVGQRIAKMNGFYCKLGAGAKPLNNKYPEESRKWLRAILAEDFDMVIPAHTVSPVRDGKAAVEEAFAWLLQPQPA